MGDGDNLYFAYDILLREDAKKSFLVALPLIEGGDKGRSTKKNNFFEAYFLL